MISRPKTLIAVKMAMPQLDESKMKLVQELEIEMMTDMYAKLTAACHKKVIRLNLNLLSNAKTFAVHCAEISRARSPKRRGSVY